MRRALLMLFLLVLSLLSVRKSLANQDGIYRLRATDGRYIDFGSAVSFRANPDTRLHLLTAQHCIKLGNVSVLVDGREEPVEVVQAMPAEPEPLVLIRTKRPMDTFSGTFK